jgi:hypothetical protein
VSQPLSREIEVEPACTALLLVDVQTYNCSWDGGEYADLGAAEKEHRYGYFFRTLKHSALPNMVLLQQACRRGGIEVGRLLQPQRRLRLRRGLSAAEE